MRLQIRRARLNVHCERSKIADDREVLDLHAAWTVNTSSNQGQTALSVSPPFHTQSPCTRLLFETLMGFRQWGGPPALHKEFTHKVQQNYNLPVVWSLFSGFFSQASLNGLGSALGVSSSVSLFCQAPASVWQAKIYFFKKVTWALRFTVLFILHWELLHQNNTRP